MSFWPYGLRNLGTDPLNLLKKLQSDGFTIKFIGKKMKPLKNKDLMKLIEITEKMRSGFINLLLEK